MKLNFFAIFLIILSGCDNCALKNSTHVKNNNPTNVNKNLNNASELNNFFILNGFDKNIYDLFEELENSSDDEVKQKALSNIKQAVNKKRIDAAGFSYTPLEQAIIDNELAIIKLLITYGADVNAQNDKTKQAALHLAIDNLDILNALIAAKDINLDITDNNDDTPLHLAVRKNKPDALKALLKAEAKHSLANKDGFTPLHLAYAYDYSDLISALLYSGADQEAVDKYGRRPIDVKDIYNKIDTDKDDKNAAMIKVSNAETKISKIEPDLGSMVPESLKNTKKVITDIKSLVNNPKVSKSDLADKVVDLGLALQSLEKDYADIKKATLTKKTKYNYSQNLKDKLADKDNALLQQHLKILEELKSSDPEVNNFIAEIKQEQKNRALGDTKIRALEKVTDAQKLHDQLKYDLAYKANFQTAITKAKNNIDNATDIDDITKSLTELSNATRTFNQADRMQAETGYPENTKPKNPEESQQSKDDKLFAAIKSGDLALVQELIANGANINALKNLVTPLSVALKDRKADITKYLLTNNKNLFTSENNTITSYFNVFIKDNNQEMVNAILDSDITIPESFLSGPIEQNNLDMVKILADKVIDINSVGKQSGFTPLYLSTIKAINNKNISLDIIKHLLSKGADPLNKVDTSTPLAMAVFNNRLDMVKIFIDKVNDLSKFDMINTLLEKAYNNQDKDLIKDLIKKGADVNKLSPYINTDFLSNKLNLDMLKFLLDQGADANFISGNKSILHSAAMFNISSLDLIKLLVAKGANLSIIDEDGKTPLQLAKEMNNTEIVDYLQSISATN